MARLAEVLLLLAALALPAAARAGEATAPVQVVLRWKPVAGAVSYQLQIARDPSFTSLELDRPVPLAGFRWTAIPENRYHWRVRGLDAHGREGTWSETRTIEPALSATVLLAPAPGARFALEGDDLAVPLRCEPSRLLAAYSLVVARDAAFTDVVARHVGPACAARFQPPGPGTYHWRAEATTLLGTAAPPSAARSFVVALGAPRLAEPEEGAALPLGEVTLRWSAIRSVARWRVAVHEHGRMIWTAQPSEPAATFAPPREGRYTWTVSAAADRDAPMAGRSFEVLPPPPLPAPRVTGPVEGATLIATDAAAPVSLRWEPVADAAGYEVQIAPASAEAGAPLASSAPELDVVLPLGELSWRLRAVDPGGRPGAWSDVARFVRVPPPPAPPAPPAPAARPVAANPRRFSLGAGAGWTTNGHRLASPIASLEATWRTPLLHDRLLLSARAGYHGASSSVALPAPAEGSMAAAVSSVPVELLAIYEHPLPPFAVYAGAGPAAEIAATSVGSRSAVALAPGALVAVGAEHPLGAGRIFAELAGGAARLDTSLARMDPLRLALRFGYRLQP